MKIFSAGSCRLCNFLVLFFLLLLPLFTGCDSKGIVVSGTLAPGTAALTTEVGNTFNYPEVFTPTQSGSQTNQVSFTIGLNQVILSSTADPSLNFIVFDTGVETPNTITLDYTANDSQTFGSNPDNPPDGTYDTVQFQVSFYTLTVPSQSGTTHQVSLSLASFLFNNTLPVCQNDILIDAQSLNFTTGQPLSAERDCSLTSQAWFMPEEQFDDEFLLTSPPTGDPYVFTLTLPTPITITDSTEDVTIKLHFGIDDILFFDDTNNNDFFDPLLLCNATSAPCDGHLTSAGRPAPNGNSTGQSAEFWLGFPTVTATGTGGGSGTTTTTTISTTTTT